MHALHGEVAVPKRVAFIPAASALGPRGASRTGRVPHARREITPSTYWMFGQRDE